MATFSWQLDRLPVEFMNTVTKTKKNIEKQIETPRLPEELESEIREIYELWTGYAQEYDGELNREIFEKILAGMHPRRQHFKHANSLKHTNSLKTLNKLSFALCVVCIQVLQLDGSRNSAGRMQGRLPTDFLRSYQQR